MRRRVVDTNVLIVANGRDTNATTACRAAAIEALRQVLRDGRIVVDAADAILAEYRRHCEPKGQPGVGDRFFHEVLMRYDGKVERIHLETNEAGDYADFPDDPDLVGFDRSDRKFAAAARKSGAPVLNATDSDWLDFAAALERHGLKVSFVCGRTRDRWFADR